jgi:hypothetical protein
MIFNFNDCSIDPKRDFSRSAWVSFCGDNKALLYIIMAENASESFIKVGMTCKSLSERFAFFPYSYQLLYADYDSPGKIYDKENDLHRVLRENGFSYRPELNFDGVTECYTLSSIFFLSEHLDIQIDIKKK